MFYVYVMEAINDGGFNIGCTQDLKNRFKEHSAGHVQATKKRRPLKLIYYEACSDRSDAFRREKYLKTTYGRRYINSRLRSYFTG
jgi:putative endonuclease